MSHLLTIATREPFDPESLGLADLRWEQDGGTVRLWREKVGARAIAVDVADGEVMVRIPILASAEDVGLAVAVATSFGVPVEVEQGGLMELADVVAFHGGDWWRGPAESAVRAFRHMLAIGRGPLTVPGPVRPMVVGARVLDELDPADPAGALVERLRRIQWDLPWDVRDASPLEVSGPEGAKIRVAVWANDADVVLPDTDYVILPADEDETAIHVLPWDRVGEVAGEAGRLLDERQWFIRRVDEATWERIRAAAAALSVAAELGLGGPRESLFVADPVRALRDDPPADGPRMPAWVPILVIVWLVGAIVALTSFGGR